MGANHTKNEGSPKKSDGPTEQHEKAPRYVTTIATNVELVDGAMELRPGRVLKLGRPRNPQAKWKALLISDSHFAERDGESYFSQACGEEMLRAMPGIVQRESPNQVFILGDVFHYRGLYTPNYCAWATETVGKLVESLAGVGEVYMIGGNHDRALFDLKGAEWEAKLGPNVSVFYGEGAPSLLEINTANGARCLLTHDGTNNLRDYDVRAFLQGLKCANGLAREPKTLLVAGHTHQAKDFSGEGSTSRMASIGCCTYQTIRGGVQYGVVEESADGSKFTLRLSGKRTAI